MANDGHPRDQGLGQDVIRCPAAFQQDVHTFFDFFFQTIIEVIHHLLDQLVVARQEVEALTDLEDSPESGPVEAATTDAPDDSDLQRRLDAANARILMLENQIRAAADPTEEADEVEADEVKADEPDAPEPAPPPADTEPTDPLQVIAARTRGDEPPRDDDLKRIRGVGPRLEAMLKEAGITSFRQVARLTPDDIEIITESLKAFRGRIERDDWMGSAAEQHLETYGEPVD